jgi:hypothetical protein
MKRKIIVLAPLMLGMLPLSAQAFPSDEEIAVVARRFCDLESTSEGDYETVLMQEFEKWTNNGSVKPEELSDNRQTEAFGTAVLERVSIFMGQMCPGKIQELEERDS